MTAIKTFVYFDLEATGLKSSGRPRISEISFVAVNSEHVEELNLKIQMITMNMEYTKSNLVINISNSFFCY